jgi:hypothetical protein
MNLYQSLFFALVLSFVVVNSSFAQVAKPNNASREQIQPNGSLQVTPAAPSSANAIIDPEQARAKEEFIKRMDAQESELKNFINADGRSSKDEEAEINRFRQLRNAMK